MSAEDYIDFDVMVNEEPDEEFVKSEWVPPKCKFCGKENLRWKQNRQGKWALYTEGGTKHVCKEFSTGFVKVGKTEKIK